MKEEIAQHIATLESAQDRFFILSSRWKTEEYLEVVADTKDGITIEECRKIAKSILQMAEEKEWDIQLDVLSPGAFSPIHDLRQVPRNIGRELEVRWKEEAEPAFSAILSDVQGSWLTFTWSERLPKAVGKGKETVHQERVVDFDTIKDLNVKLPF